MKLIGVKFSDTNKIYYFGPKDLKLVKGDKVIVETEKGIQFAESATNIYEVDENKIQFVVKDVLRKATDEDCQQNLKNIEEASGSIEKANELIKELKLDMKVTNVSYTLDQRQMMFSFVAEERVDFRELAKRLSKIYRTRIELRQIGVRDKAKDVGGLGQCGRELCCHMFLNDINSVSINMAKNQNLALNPQKINGSCGRLMCCLNYENKNYVEFSKGLPTVGKVVETEFGSGKVVELDILNRKYKVDVDGRELVTIEVKNDSKK